jgi:thiamine-phosphate pyrophosphorylase
MIERTVHGFYHGCSIQGLSSVLVSIPPIYPILDSATLEKCGYPMADAADALLEAGARILQFRHKGPFTRGVFAAAERVSELCRAAGAIYVIDDRADVALLLDAGVHLGQDDLRPAEAREIVGPARLIGFSTHNEDQLRAASDEPVDYIAVGPIFATGSKANPDPVLGVEELRRLRGLTGRPLVAIGGIRPEAFAAMLSAGADSIALIAGWMPDVCTKAAIRTRFDLLLATAKAWCHNPRE